MNQKFNELIFIIVSIIVLTNAELHPLPDYIKLCRRNSDFEKCFINSIEILRPKIASGMPELNIPALEPLRLGDLVLSRKEDTGIFISVRDLKVYNATSFKIIGFQSKNFVEHLNVELILPKFQVDGFYNLEGRILALPLKGNGDFRGSFTNIKAKVKFSIDTIQKDGDEYFKLSQIRIKAKMGKGRLRLNNLFDGNKELSDATNEAINENIIEIADEILPSIEKALEKRFSEIADKFFELFRANQLLLN